MTDLEQYNRQLRRDKIIHYLLITTTILLFIIGGVVFYAGVNRPSGAGSNVEEMIQEASQNEEAAAKSLPDFIIDKVPNDELEQLKP
ncbi:MAG: hypothetical protein ACRBDL_09215 [Alphaproteobacteria bacterium]